jgi:hypothetical protein
MADATTWGRLERIVRWQVDAGAYRTLASLPKDEAERPERALVNFPPDVSEATVSVAVKLTTPIPVHETGERNACEV